MYQGLLWKNMNESIARGVAEQAVVTRALDFCAGSFRCVSFFF